MNTVACSDEEPGRVLYEPIDADARGDKPAPCAVSMFGYMVVLERTMAESPRMLNPQQYSAPQE